MKYKSRPKNCLTITIYSIVTPQTFRILLIFVEQILVLVTVGFERSYLNQLVLWKPWTCNVSNFWSKFSVIFYFWFSFVYFTCVVKWKTLSWQELQSPVAWKQQTFLNLLPWPSVLIHLSRPQLPENLGWCLTMIIEVRHYQMVPIMVKDFIN